MEAEEGGPMDGIWQRVVGRISGSRRAGKRSGAVLALCAAALLMGAGSAQASVTLTSFSTSPSTTLAGGYPDVTAGAKFSYSNSTDDLKSLQVFLPPGLLGNPSVV